ncbi:PREDICTED: coiled-coil domain-containing protein 3-like, partial [Eurypyga helias]|uniref:coiled-coil domain-containing protein 3-like n=1 Tax=Eurypyga helias TaxID=54383 RepID=UPI000528E817
MDENYILLPHGVNFQEAIFPDTQENRRMFASLFQFSNCSQAQHVLSFSSDWEIQEDNRLLCASAWEGDGVSGCHGVRNSFPSSSMPLSR